MGTPIFGIFPAAADLTSQNPDNVRGTNNLILADKRVIIKEFSLQVEVGEARTVAVEKHLCQVGSEDVEDGCPQRNPENSEQQTFRTARGRWR